MRDCIIRSFPLTPLTLGAAGGEGPRDVRGRAGCQSTRTKKRRTANEWADLGLGVQQLRLGADELLLRLLDLVAVVQQLDLQLLVADLKGLVADLRLLLLAQDLRDASTSAPHAVR